MTTQQGADLIGLIATDVNGAKVGKVGQVYLDEGTGQPQLVTVSTGMFGTRESFAPLSGSSVRGDQLMLAVSRELVKDAPNIENDGHLDEADVTALHQHYVGYLEPAAQDPASEGKDGVLTLVNAIRNKTSYKGQNPLNSLPNKGVVVKSDAGQFKGEWAG